MDEEGEWECEGEFNNRLSSITATSQWRTVIASAELTEGAVQAFDLGPVIGFVARTGGQLRILRAQRRAADPISCR